MIPKKIKLNNIELPNYDFMREAISSLYTNLSNQLDTAIIKGLKRKGFEFGSKSELELFVKNRCRCEEYQPNQERIYYVDDIPFFLHNYKVEITQPTFEDRQTTMSANYGTFEYL